MDYIKQLNAFWRLLPNNPLSSNAVCLYVYLLSKDNEFCWKKEFTVPNLIICGSISLSRQALDRARNELIQKGYIKYKKGISNQAGKYVIVSFDTQNDTQESLSVDFVTQDNTQDDTQDNTQGGHEVSTLNKLNKTKLNNKLNKKNIKKFGEYENVKLDDEQYEKLLNEFPNDYEKRIQSLDGYIQSTGKKYKDHLATIRNWARKEGYKKLEKVEYKAIDTEGLTDEEYERLLRERRKNV